MLGGINGMKRYAAIIMRFGVVLSIGVFLAIVRPEFLTMNNLVNVARQSSLLFLISVGLTITILGAGIDLSIGSVLTLSACILGSLLKTGSFFLAVLAGLAVGACCGFVNGALVALIGLPPFMATYGMLWIAQGLAIMVIKSEIIFGFPESFRIFGAGYLIGIPVPIIIAVVIFGVLYFILIYTVLGRDIYSVGASMEVAKLSGIPVKRTQIITYTLSGFLNGCAAIVYVSRMNSVEGGVGESLLLPALAAVAIGGTSLFGGEGGIGNTIIGAIIMSLVINGMNLIGMTSNWQSFAIGSIVLFSVVTD
jgi:ribose transport system permease protein